jgi:tripartite ATP-independent transporter DctM subunit
MLILYGATAGVSVVKLYAGAFLPGFGLALAYIVYLVVRATLNPALAPKLPRELRDVPLRKIAYELATGFLPLAALTSTVLGCILFGLATPSESAAMGALGALVLAAGYRSLTFGRLRESVYLTVRTTAMVCWLFVGSALFSAVFGYLGGQSVVENFVLSLNLSPLTFMIMAQLIIFLLGWPLEWTEIIIIFVPIFLPMLDDFGIDPLFFGVMVALNLQTSFLSPPVAMSAFYLKGVAPKEITINQIFAGMMPFMWIVLLFMSAVYAFPGIITWLPTYLYGGGGR